MSRFSIREFRPTIFFLTKFIGLYLIGNLLYGIYVSGYRPKPDAITNFVSHHLAVVLTACGMPVKIQDDDKKPNTLIIYEDHAVLAVYEGCNGVNTMIIFLSFLFAFGPISRVLMWFIPLGLLIIHVANLLRLSVLFYVAEKKPEYMYFMHKYFFTAVLYAVVFMLWVWWVKKYALRK